MDLFDLDPQGMDSWPARMAWSFREARILQVAVRMGLFSALHERAKSHSRLATELGADPDMTERLLVALAALNLVIHDRGLWRNCLAATMYLVRDQPLYLGHVIEMASNWWEVYHDLEQLIREGRHGDRYQFWRQKRLGRDEVYLKAMHALALAGQAQRLARHASVLGGRRTLLDVGGAPGTYSVALCQRFATLRVTLLDQAESLSQTEQVIHEFGMEERITLKEADWARERLGNDEYEALMLNHSMVGSEAQGLVQLMRAYEALKAGGVLVVQSFLLDNDLNGSPGAALFNLLDNAFTLEQMRALLAEAGFERITLLFRSELGQDILTAYKPLSSPTDTENELVAYMSPEQEIFAMMRSGEDDSDALTVQRGMRERLVQSN
ncbi:MAG: hypothetical protein H0T73_11425 [Ardenticatenales bacterium]|nr:hypothetical protein [Ardenticatenales bacterium]